MLQMAEEAECRMQDGSTQGIKIPAPTKRAAHEAAHAVLARWFGFVVTSMRIIDDDPNDSAPGSTNIIWGEQPIDPQERQVWAMKRACVSFAGFCATSGTEAGSEQWKLAEAEMRDDLFLAFHTLVKNIDACKHSARRMRLLGEANRDAGLLVAKTTAAREHLADELLKRGRLGQQEIETIVDPLLPPRCLDPQLRRLAGCWA